MPALEIIRDQILSRAGTPMGMLILGPRLREDAKTQQRNGYGALVFRVGQSAVQHNQYAPSSLSILHYTS